MFERYAACTDSQSQLEEARRQNEHISSPDVRLVVQNDVQQRTVDLDTSVVPNEAEFPKFVHEEAHARPCRSNHFRQRLLANFRDHRLGCPFLAEICQQQ